MSVPHAFAELQRSDLPVTLRAFRTDTDEKVWEEVITDACSVQVPPLGKELGAPIRIELETGKGVVITEEPI